MPHHSTEPRLKPRNPSFSSGPCPKRPGWSATNLKDAFVGRSHRSAMGKGLLKQIIDQHRHLLNIPEDYSLAIVPASDTGAVEMALWSLLGAKAVDGAVDVLSFESFSQTWAKDITNELKIEKTRILSADYGYLPDLAAVNFDHDVVFAWNGTTSGVVIPNGDWIDPNRRGLTICDATSAVFAYDMPWDKLDVVTWSWQKVLGGEAAHGMIALSPQAIQRLESHVPSWPMPKIFRMTKKGKLDQALFQGATINTPSMLCVADVLDSLAWIETIGGLNGIIKRVNNNYSIINNWVAQTPWIDFLCADPTLRSVTSVCLKFNDNEINPKDMIRILEQHEAAFDIGAYRDAPAGLRIWCGGTVESDDVTCLTQWLDWAYHTLKNQ